MKVLHSLAAFIILLTGALGMPQVQAGTHPAIGWIEVQVINDGEHKKLRIQGHVSAHEAVEGSYRLTIKKADRGNSSTSGQSGGFRLEAGEEKGLSVTTINITGSEKLSVMLELMNADGVISTATITY